MSSSNVTHYAKNLFDLHTSAWLQKKKWILHNCRRFSHFFSKKQTGNINSTQIWVVCLNMYIWQHFSSTFFGNVSLHIFEIVWVRLHKWKWLFVGTHFLHSLHVCQSDKMLSIFFYSYPFQNHQCRVQTVQKRFEWNSVLFFLFFSLSLPTATIVNVESSVCLISWGRMAWNVFMMQCWNCVDVDTTQMSTGNII